MSNVCSVYLKIIQNYAYVGIELVLVPYRSYDHEDIIFNAQFQLQL
jgi:hypothetical protein